MARIYTEFIKPTPWLSSRSVLIVTVAVQSLPDGPIALSKWSIFACPMRKLGTTLSWRLSAEAARERQAVALTDLDFRHRGSLPTIIAGDFNAGPDATSIRYLSGLQSINGRSVKYQQSRAKGLVTPFTSPLDNRINRVTYFERCWPNSERIEGFDF